MKRAIWTRLWRATKSLFTMQRLQETLSNWHRHTKAWEDTGWLKEGLRVRFVTSRKPIPTIPFTKIRNSWLESRLSASRRPR